MKLLLILLMTVAMQAGAQTVLIEPGCAFHLIRFDSLHSDEDRPNSTLHLISNNNSVFVDSVYIQYERIDLKDFNRDKVPDILVLHTSSARSNWSHYLYLKTP